MILNNTTRSPSSQFNAKVWPISIRVFHATLISLMIGLAVSSMNDAWLKIHINLGYLVCGLLIWRFYYGFAGPAQTRFVNFVVSPGQLYQYLRLFLRKVAPLSIGHPPTAGWGILLLLSVIGLTSVSGIIVFLGEERFPIFGLMISSETGNRFRNLHEILAWLNLGVIVLHVCGVLLDSWMHRVNLPLSMITGKKWLPNELFTEYTSLTQEGPHAKTAMFLITIVLVVFGSFAWYSQNAKFSRNPPAETAENLIAQQLWAKECGACHQAFHPSLLPAKAWLNMMQELENHFGEDASLAEGDKQVIAQYLSTHAAEFSPLEPAYKILLQLKKDEIPSKITETRYWQEKHKHIPATVFARPGIKRPANCLACHLDADSGEFDDHRIFSPISNE